MIKRKQKTTQNNLETQKLTYAKSRIKQKKQLFGHLVFYLIGILAVGIANVFFDIQLELLGISWIIFLVVLWSVLLLYHFVNVFIVNRFLGKKWEEQQLKALLKKQDERIYTLTQHFIEKEIKLAQHNPTGDVLEPKINKTLADKQKAITLIVAKGEDDAIGKNNGLIWHLAADLKRFKQLTSGHHIIMGRKTFESFPKPLPNRTHIVITRQAGYEVPQGVIVVNNFEDALDAAKKDKQPFVIGGAEIYKLVLNAVDKLEITTVHAEFPEADTFFPAYNKNLWHKVSEEFHKADETHPYNFTFETYMRF